MGEEWQSAWEYTFAGVNVRMRTCSYLIFFYTEINAYAKVLVHFAILLVYFLAFRCHTYRFNYVVQSINYDNDSIKVDNVCSLVLGTWY